MTHKKIRTVKVAILILEVLAFLMLFQNGAIDRPNHNCNDCSVFEAALNGYFPGILMVILGLIGLGAMTGAYIASEVGYKGEKAWLPPLFISAIHAAGFMVLGLVAADKTYGDDGFGGAIPVVQTIGILLAVLFLWAILFGCAKKLGITEAEE